METDITDRILSIIAIGLLLLLGLAFYSAAEESKEKAAMAAQCSKSGGVYLEHVYRVGKTSNHQYVCMKKNLFVDMEEQ